MTEKQAEEAVRKNLEDYLHRMGQFPDNAGRYHCISPDHKDGNPSMTIEKNGKYAKCWSHPLPRDTFNIFDAISMLEGIRSLHAQKKRAFKLYGIEVDEGSPEKAVVSKTDKQPKIHASQPQSINQSDLPPPEQPVESQSPMSALSLEAAIQSEERIIAELPLEDQSQILEPVEVVEVIEEIPAAVEPEPPKPAEPEPPTPGEPEIEIPEPVEVVEVIEEIPAVVEPEPPKPAEPEPPTPVEPEIEIPEPVEVVEVIEEIPAAVEVELPASAEPEPLASAGPEIEIPEPVEVMEVIEEIPAVVEPEPPKPAEPEPPTPAEPEIEIPEPVEVAETIEVIEEIPAAVEVELPASAEPEPLASVEPEIEIPEPVEVAETIEVDEAIEIAESIEKADSSVVNEATEQTVENTAESLEPIRYDSQTCMADYIVQFLAGDQKASARLALQPAVSTGFTELDKHLDGGLFPGLYLCCSRPGEGKTSFALQIADSLSAQGVDVLLISMDMTRLELAAKSISRLSLLLDHTIARSQAKTMRQIMDELCRMTGEEWAQSSLFPAMQAYQQMSRHLYVLEAETALSSSDILRLIEQHIETTHNRPVVFVDSLQYMKPAETGQTETALADAAVRALMQISRSAGTPIFALSSVIRDNYACDVVLSLQMEPAAGTLAAPHQVDLKILKNRHGMVDGKVSFNDYAVFSYFEVKSDKVRS